MKLMAELGDYVMDQIILDLCLDANVLSIETWECMVGLNYNVLLFNCG